MSQIARILNYFLLMLMRQLFDELKKRGLNRLRLGAAKLYVQSVKEVRRLALGVITVFVCLAVLAAGCALLPIGIAIIIYNRTNNVEVTGFVLAGIAVIFLLISMLTILIFTSENLWIRVFRVRQVVKLALARRKIESN